MITINFKGRKDLYDYEELCERCFECSVCSLHCVIQNREGYGGRKTFVYDLFSSEAPQIHEALWACSGCHKCVDVCPQEVDPLKVIVSLQEQSFEEGDAPSYVYDLVGLVLETGMAFPVTKKTFKDREKLGLPPPEAKGIDEVRRIAGLTGLEKKLKGKKTGDR
jgi:heterodisulfide reductase subunit C